IALILFFFSSRRRHTRFSRDWSSDVCSSDLALHSSKRLSPPKTGKRPRRTLAAGGRGTRDRRAYPFIGRVVHGRGGPTAKICPKIGRATGRERVWNCVGGLPYMKTILTYSST